MIISREQTNVTEPNKLKKKHKKRKIVLFTRIYLNYFNFNYYFFCTNNNSNIRGMARYYCIAHIEIKKKRI